MIQQTTMSCLTDHFNDVYYELHEFLLQHGDNVASRNGATMELLNFKTIIKKPIRRCIGGYKRNINVFFLLAEALWIFAGRKDVSFLDTFNGQLKQYSDDGITYHAPYGWRLRNWGRSTSAGYSIADDSSKHSVPGFDQIGEIIDMLSINPDDRRAVASIWNPEFDLNVQCKDIPCNDMIMYKIREGKLYCTIANRSNDLNLGLTTNVFQFSFINEIVARILNVGLGDQVHNSQSLHLYLNHSMTSELHSEITSKNFPSNSNLLYEDAKAIQMDFNFSADQPNEDKLRLIDFHINSIIWCLSTKVAGAEPSEEYLDNLKEFSRYLYFVYKLLEIYVNYKAQFPLQGQSGTKVRMDAFTAIEQLAFDMPEFKESDYKLLAQNFFFSKISETADLDLKGTVMRHLGKY